MDVRLAALGIALLVSSLGLLLYSLNAGLQSVAGVALSTSVLGGVVAALGITYRDPLGAALLQYSRSLNKVLTKVYEDLGLLEREVLQVCRAEDGVLVVYAQKRVPCREVRPGVGLAEQVPYLAVQIGASAPETSDPQEALRELGLADVVRVYRSEGEVVAELVGIRRELVGEEWRPLNPVQVLTAAILASTVGADLVREEEEHTGDLYRARFRVLPG